MKHVRMNNEEVTGVSSNFYELTTFLKTLNYTKVESYDDVCDIMDLNEYDLIEQEELWRCD